MEINIVRLSIALQPEAKIDNVTDWLNETLGGDMDKLVLDWAYALPERTATVPDSYTEGDFLDAVDDEDLYRAR
jgi:hypothetical protein